MTQRRFRLSSAEQEARLSTKAIVDKEATIIKGR